MSGKTRITPYLTILHGTRLALHDYHAMVQHPNIDLLSVSVRVPRHRLLDATQRSSDQSVRVAVP